MHSDVLILKLWFAVHRIPNKLRPCLSPFSSHDPFPVLYFSFPSHSSPVKIDEVFICCRPFTVMCTMGLHLSRSIYVSYVWKSKFWTKACYSVSLVYIEGQSLLFFCHAPEKWEYGTPTQKSGVCLPQKLRIWFGVTDGGGGWVADVCHISAWEVKCHCYIITIYACDCTLLSGCWCTCHTCFSHM